MELLYKAQIFALFAVPSILAIGIAEVAKPKNSIIKFGLYGFGAVSAILSITLPFAH